MQKGVEKQRTEQAKARDTKRKHKASQFRAKTVAKYRKGLAGKFSVDELSESESESEIEEHESLLDITQRQFVEYVRAHDVVVTTYQ
jgi:E3 ubiquitin-protein ligase SHPRH